MIYEYYISLSFLLFLILLAALKILKEFQTNQHLHYISPDWTSSFIPLTLFCLCVQATLAHRQLKHHLSLVEIDNELNGDELNNLFLVYHKFYSLVSANFHFQQQCHQLQQIYRVCLKNIMTSTKLMQHHVNYQLMFLLQVEVSKIIMEYLLLQT